MRVPVPRWGALVTIMLLAGSTGGPWGLASEVSGGIGSNIDNNFVVTWHLADRLYLLTTA